MRKLVTIGILLVATTAISQIAVTNIPTQNVDVQQRINNIIERYRKVEERGTKYDKENPPSQNWGGLVRAGAHLLNSLGDIGDRAALPFLEELALSTNTHNFARECSVRTYFKIADLSEIANLMVQYCSDPTITQGKWSMVQLYIDKLNASDINSIAPETKDYINTCLLKILLTTDVRDVGNRLNIHLLNAIPSYSNSIQRATLTRFATEGNEWVTNTFQPIKAHFDTLPKSELVDLREQFPDLPPLPSEEERGMMWVYGVGGIVLVVVCLAVGFRCVRCGVRGSK